MPLRTVGVMIPEDVMSFAHDRSGIPGISINRLIEAGIRVFLGESMEDVRTRFASSDRGKELENGGQRFARLDESLIDGINNKSRAARIGLGMIAYGWDRERAEKWADTAIKWGRRSEDEETI